jgi:hypothetical protein
LPDPLVTVEFETAVTGSSVLRIALAQPPASGRGRALLTASSGAASTCEGSGEIRCNVAGALPDTLSLMIASARATVDVRRGGVQVAASFLLRDSTVTTIRLPFGR